MNASKVKTYLQPMGSHRRFIATLAIGEKYLTRWESLSLPLWRIYCERHNIGLVAMVSSYTDPQSRRADWQKFLLGRAMEESGYESGHVCFVDYDVVPNPYAPNVFLDVREENVGFVSEIFGLPYGEIKSLRRRVAFHRNRVSSGSYPLNSYLTAPVGQIYRDAGLSVLTDYGCGGLFIFNIEEHAKTFEREFSAEVDANRLTANVGEEVHLNHLIQSEFDVHWLPYEWHTLWFYEVAAYYPWLYARDQRSKDRVEQAIVSTLLRSHFLHFVGSWEKWAWTAVQGLLQGDAFAQLERFEEFRHIPLTSPSLGQIFPEGEEKDMLSL